MAFETVCTGDVVDGDWMYYDLLAVDGEGRLAFVQNEADTLDRNEYDIRGRYDQKYLQSLGVSRLDWVNPYEMIGDQQDQPMSGFADGSNIYVSAPGRGMTELHHTGYSVSDWSDFEVRTIYPVEGVLGGQAVRGLGLLLDLEDGTVLAKDGAVTVIDSDPNISLKAFPRSRSYPRLATAVKEDHLTLLAFWPSPPDDE